MDILGTLYYFFTLFYTWLFGSVQQTKLNILMIVSDDMRPELGCFLGQDFPSPVHPKIHSPNLDGLASRSLLLRRAYVQQAVCSPSRTSTLTSRRPDTTHVTGNVEYFRLVGGNFTTLPQYFKQHGYRALGMGKIFHPGKEASGFDDPPSWSDPYYHAPYEDYWFTKNYSFRAVSAEVQQERPLPDDSVLDHAVNMLHTVAPAAKAGQQPFFMAVGFLKPHLPFIFPEEFLQYYPLSDISVPDNPYAPVDMPTPAWSDYEELRSYKDIQALHVSGNINTSLPDAKTLQLRQGYYAALTYTDHLIGKLLSALEKEGLAEDTIIVFWGDHGWQLGEHGEWCKHTNFELATHAPMMIHIPGTTDQGVVTELFTEYVDLYPSLVEAAGLPALSLCPEDSHNIPACTEGSSFLPLIHNPKSPHWKNRIFSQFPRGSLMGYTMRYDKYRYTEWVKYLGKPDYRPDWDQNHGTELYDHEIDPEENVNRANYSEYSKVAQQLKALLHKGWRAALPANET